MKALGIFLAVLILAAVFVVFFDSAAGAGSTPTVTETYLVRPGDTLWSIAADKVGPEQDVRTYIQTLKRLNELDGAGLSVGRNLLLPVDSS